MARLNRPAATQIHWKECSPLPTANNPETNAPLGGVTPSFFARYQQAILLSLLLIGVICTVAFGLQGYQALRRLIENPQPIVRPWMTIPRVARQFHIPEDNLYRALDVTPQRPDRRPLNQLARQQGRAISDVVGEVQRLVDSYRPVPPAPTPTAWQGSRYAC